MKDKGIRFLAIFGGTTIIALAVAAFFLIDQGMPKEFSEEAWSDTKEKAIQTTVEHFKTENNIDITINEVSFSGEYATHEVYLEGYVVGNENKKISAVVDTSEDDYQVKSVNMNA
ncbi:phosphoglycolate phosphatase [Lysinibacillus sp. Ag94]|uniref:phosphoglycolate phosphatase n=1 Tax=Lysinibacillus sp. Ag94 TaxID=2936682 RepID=UPI00200D7B29|nr:phosphoglycolate phosphatase [Lysinibacillus sp. Ag94]UPW81299.1 phosphoglycolate phosphatase [Lysinibacillus sp. Ag94]